MIDRTKTYMAVPAYNTDKIIGIVSGSNSSGTPTIISDASATETLQTGFGDTCYFEGVYTIDGTTWNDFGSSPIDTSGASPVFQTYDCNCYMNGGDIIATVTSYYNLVAGTGTNRDFEYKIVLFSKNQQGELTPIPTEESQRYSSQYNFQKIYMQDEIPFNLTSGASQSSTIIHDLGYEPKVRAWFNTGSRIYPIQYVVGTLVSNQYNIECRITDTTVQFFIDAARSGLTQTGNIEYRIYLDD